LESRAENYDMQSYDLTAMLAFISYTPIVKIHVGPLAISPHALGIVFGFLAGARLVRPAMRRRGIKDEQLYDCLTRAAVGAAIGARVAYVANHLGDYNGRPLEAFAVWQGGISLLGGIFGAVVAAYHLMRRLRFPFFSTMDAAAPGLALGILIGRIGDLIVGDHLGKPTDFVLGFRCTGADTASPCLAPVGHAVHMPALYDLISVTVLLAVLLVVHRRPRPTGFLILLFTVWYGAGRLVEDFFRVDVTHGTGLTGSQWASVAMILGGCVLLGRLARRRVPDSGYAVVEDAGGQPIA
jgi:phosphatidylglycerol:prolipoprotein diacylglycerol transferase